MCLVGSSNSIFTDDWSGALSFSHTFWWTYNTVLKVCVGAPGHRPQGWSEATQTEQVSNHHAITFHATYFYNISGKHVL